MENLPQTPPVSTPPTPTPAVETPTPPPVVPAPAVVSNPLKPEVVSQPVPTTPATEITPPTPLTQTSGYRKFLIPGGIIAFFVVVGGTLFYYGFFNKTLTSSDVSQATSSSQSSGTITFDSATYTKGFTFPETPGKDHTSKSYEWVTGGETVENWSTLITTHILSPLSPDKPLSASVYAQNAIVMNTDRGAKILEASIINTPDAIAGGVDINNPPYIIVYIFPSDNLGNSAEPIEFVIQKVINGVNGSVEAFIYAERMVIKTDQDLVNFVLVYLASPEYAAKRLAVIKAQVPRDANATSTENTKGMSVEDAKAMVQIWIAESRAMDRDIRGSLTVDSKGDFLVLIKGAFFRYNATDRTLLISGLVGYDIKTLSDFPTLWQFLVRAGQREHTTMMYGEANFELVTEQMFEFKPDVILLTKPYTERLTDGRKLGVQISWLLLDADYWFVNRYNEVMAKPEADLIKEAPALNDWMIKNRPKPW